MCVLRAPRASPRRFPREIALTSPARPHRQAPSESTAKRLSSEDVIKYTKDFMSQFREVRTHHPPPPGAATQLDHPGL